VASTLGRRTAYNCAIGVLVFVFGGHGVGEGYGCVYGTISFLNPHKYESRSSISVHCAMLKVLIPLKYQY
jgi:hypothetical protein